MITNQREGCQVTNNRWLGVNLKFTCLNPVVKSNISTPGFSYKQQIFTPRQKYPLQGKNIHPWAAGRPSTTPLGQPWHRSLVCSTGWHCTVEQGWTMFSRATYNKAHKRRSGVDDFIAGTDRHTQAGAHRGLAPCAGTLHRRPIPPLTPLQHTYSCSSFFSSHCWCTANCMDGRVGASLKIVIVVVVVVVTTPASLLPVNFVVLTSERDQCASRWLSESLKTNLANSSK